MSIDNCHERVYASTTGDQLPQDIPNPLHGPTHSQVLGLPLSAPRPRNRCENRAKFTSVLDSIHRWKCIPHAFSLVDNCCALIAVEDPPAASPPDKTLDRLLCELFDRHVASRSQPIWTADESAAFKARHGTRFGVSASCLRATQEKKQNNNGLGQRG